MWSWQTVVEAAVGAAVPVVPIYVLFFRQVVESKNAQIEALKDRIDNLESERVVEVIREKQLLVEELRTQARERKELEAEIEREVGKISALVRTQVLEEVGVKVKEVHEKILELGNVAKERISTNTQVGILTGRISLTRISYWLNGLTGKVDDPVTKSLDRFMRREMDWLEGLRLKVRNEGYILTMEDVDISQETLNELREQARTERKALDSGETSKGS